MPLDAQQKIAANIAITKAADLFISFPPFGLATRPVVEWLVS
jgi:hypothetical protein